MSPLEREGGPNLPDLSDKRILYLPPTAAEENPSERRLRFHHLSDPQPAVSFLSGGRQHSAGGGFRGIDVGGLGIVNQREPSGNLERLRLFFGDDDFRQQWLVGLINAREQGGLITPAAAETLRTQANDHIVLSCVRDIGVTTGIEIATVGLSLVIPQLYGLVTQDIVGTIALNAALNLSCISPSGIIRAPYFAGMAIKETVRTVGRSRELGISLSQAFREDRALFENYAVAILISPIKIIGFFAPAIFAARTPEMSLFLLSSLAETASEGMRKIGAPLRKVPVVGEAMGKAVMWADEYFVKGTARWIGSVINHHNSGPSGSFDLAGLDRGI